MAQSRNFWWVAGAAAVVAGGVWYFQSNREPQERAVSPSEMRENMKSVADYTPPKYEPVKVVDQGPAAAAFRDAMKPYEDSDYVEASKRLGVLLKKHPEYAPAHFYRGAAELMQGHASVAIGEMNNVLHAKDESLSEEARWGLAKAALTHGDVGQGRVELERLAAGNGEYAAPAKELLNRLKSVK